MLGDFEVDFSGPQEEKACLPVGAEPDRSWKLRPNDQYNLTMPLSTKKASLSCKEPRNRLEIASK